MANTLIATSNTKTSKLATAITKEIKKEGSVYINGIGAGAVNQIVKAIAVATIYLEEKDGVLVCKPKFVRTEMDRNAISFFAVLLKED